MGSSSGSRSKLERTSCSRIMNSLCSSARTATAHKIVSPCLLGAEPRVKACEHSRNRFTPDLVFVVAVGPTLGCCYGCCYGGCCCCCCCSCCCSGPLPLFALTVGLTVKEV